MDGHRALSRRDFLQLRRSDRGKVLELSCRSLFMRCADAAINAEPVEDWEPWMGEPPAVINRQSADEILGAFEQDLLDVQVLRLHEPGWLDSLAQAARVNAAIVAFRARGGVVELASG